MIRLKKRERPRFGTLRAAPREFPRHRKFVRSHECVVLSVGGEIAWEDACHGFGECAHYRTAENSGVGLKPADWHCFPACAKHHQEQHRIGQPAFERKYGLKLDEICAELARRSPDRKMREAMKDGSMSDPIKDDVPDFEFARQVAKEDAVRELGRLFQNPRFRDRERTAYEDEIKRIRELIK